MEPQIQYARAPDGVSLAWYAVGAGLPLLWTSSGPFTNIEYEWRIPETRAILERIAAAATLIRYDARGFSLSDRDVTDFSLDTMVGDLETIADACGHDRVVIMTPGIMSIPALVYAARHPQRVIALVLTGGVGRGIDAVDSEYERMLDLARRDWEIFKRLLGGTSNLWALNATVIGLQDMLEHSTTQETYVRWCESWPDWDATDVLGTIHAPTLITPIDSNTSAEDVRRRHRRLAAAIPTAKLVFADALNTNVVAEFLASVVRGPESPPSRGSLRTVLFTDLVGHTEMMQRLGDAKGRDVLRDHERITRELLQQHGGAEVKAMGDGFMASFGSVTQAMECAIALQRAFAAHSESMPEPLHVRVGLNAGEPIEEDGDLFGSTVILASRIAAKAGAGEILVPDTVRGLLSGKGFMFTDRGEFVPKGFDEGVRLYEVRWQ
jgi:class 3 adenylate cyclase